MEITQDLHSSIGKSRIDVIYVDFSKAFDRIDHGIMASKLARYSTPLLPYKTIMNFIVQRRYIMKIDGEPQKEQFTTFSAVPQGSHCGPLLFIVYTADIKDIVAQLTSKLLQYADDLRLYKAITNEDDIRDLQQAIDNLTEWSNINRLPLNIEKTFHMSFARKNEKSREHSNYYEMQRIKTVNEVRDLGVIFDTHLTFQAHINKSITTANRLSAMSMRFANEINYSMISFLIFNVYIAPILLYACTIWDQNVTKTSEAIEKILHFITRTTATKKTKSSEIQTLHRTNQHAEKFDATTEKANNINRQCL